MEDNTKHCQGGKQRACRDKERQFFFRFDCGEDISAAAWLFPFIGALIAIDLTVKGLSDIYVARIYEEVKNRPVYIVKERFNDQSDD